MQNYEQLSSKLAEIAIRMAIVTVYNYSYHYISSKLSSRLPWLPVLAAELENRLYLAYIFGNFDEKRKVLENLGIKDLTLMGAKIFTDTSPKIKKTATNKRQSSTSLKISNWELSLEICILSFLVVTLQCLQVCD